MGIVTTDKARYAQAVKKLFPQGEYWTKRFADPSGDVSLFAKAKPEELLRYRSCMSALPGESRIETTEELIADRERVLLGEVTYGKTLEERRLLLKSKQDNKLNRAELQKIADRYGLTIIDIVFPFRPAFFGHAVFNTSFPGGPVCFSVVLITASWPGEEFRALFKANYPIQRFGTMRFGLERLARLAIDRLWYYRDRTFRAASAGFLKPGVRRLFSSPVYKIRPIVKKRLQAASAGFTRFGTNRLIYSPFPAMRLIVARRGKAGIMRTGGDRLMYTSVRQIKKAVYDRIRDTGTGFARSGRSRIMPMPFYQIGMLLQQRFRAVSCGAVKCGLSRPAHYTGGFSNALVRHEAWLFNGFTKAALETGGVVSRTDAPIVDAIIGESDFLYRFDTAPVGEILRQDGLPANFDGYFTPKLIQKHKFYPRLEKAFINHVVRDKGLFREFESAVYNKLPANQIPYFSYEGA
jgi:hypothetical protein